MALIQLSLIFKMNTMKKVIVITALFAVALLSSAKIVSDRLGRPAVKDGFQIFYLCEPVDDYEKIGYVKVKVVWNGNPAECLGIILKKAKSDYPTGDAVVISSIDMDEAIVVKFK